jgi:hypothetical protein
MYLYIISLLQVIIQITSTKLKVPITVTMENAAFWNVTACSLLIQTNILEEDSASIPKV